MGKNIFAFVVTVAAIVFGQWLLEAPHSGGDALVFLRHTMGVWVLVITGMVYYAYLRSR